MAEISEKIVAGLRAPAKGNKLHYFSGAKLAGKTAPAGFAVRCTSTDTKSFVLFHRHGGRQFLETLGRWHGNAGGGSMTVAAAIARAKERAAELDKAGVDPRPLRTKRREDGAAVDGVMTVAQLIDKYVERMRRDRGDSFRTLNYVAAALDRLVVKSPSGKRSIYEVKRRDINDLLDQIADRNGVVMADRVLGYLRAVFNWRAKADDDLVPPFAKGMARTRPQDRARGRVLDDREIAAIWAATDDGAPASRFFRFLLLTGCRRGEAAAMPWSEIAEGTWSLPMQRNKAKFPLARPLAGAALAQCVANGRVQVFGFSNAGMTRAHKALLQKSGTTDWIIHDVRRSTRTLLARAGVSFEIAERCLGHRQGRIEETYNKHQYQPEMARAYEALAQLIERIAEPKENVVVLRGR